MTEYPVCNLTVGRAPVAEGKGKPVASDQPGRQPDQHPHGKRENGGSSPPGGTYGQATKSLGVSSSV